MPLETYYTPDEAAEYLRSSPSTLAKLRLYGTGPAFTRIGRVIRYRRTDLDRWMGDKLARSTAEIGRASELSPFARSTHAPIEKEPRRGFSRGSRISS